MPDCPDRVKAPGRAAARCRRAVVWPTWLAARADLNTMQARREMIAETARRLAEIRTSIRGGMQDAPRAGRACDVCPIFAGALEPRLDLNQRALDAAPTSCELRCEPGRLASDRGFPCV